VSSSAWRRAVASLLAALILALSVPAAPAAAMTGTITGKVVDSVTQAPIQNVALYLGIPGAFVWARTAVDGSFSIDLTPIQYNPNTEWEVYFVKEGYVITKTNKFKMTTTGYVFGSEPAVVPANFPLVKQIVGPRSSCTDTTGLQPAPTLTQTLYLPNITRNLGGSFGWYTPFIVQNTGTASTMLEVSFYDFVDGSCKSRSLVSGIAPGTSYANDPRDSSKNPTLPMEGQFAVVVKSYGSTVVGVVNEHQGPPPTGGQPSARAEAMSYNGFTAGANTVFLPNITRRLFNLFVTPFIIQNLGEGTANVQATFRTFDGTGSPVTVGRTIEPGRSKPVDPNSNDFQIGAPGLTDNKHGHLESAGCRRREHPRRRIRCPGARGLRDRRRHRRRGDDLWRIRGEERAERQPLQHDRRAEPRHDRGHADDHVHAARWRSGHREHIHVRDADQPELVEGVRSALLVQHAGDHEHAVLGWRDELSRRRRVQHSHLGRSEPRRCGQRHQRHRQRHGDGLFRDVGARDEVLPAQRDAHARWPERLDDADRPADRDRERRVSPVASLLGRSAHHDPEPHHPDRVGYAHRSAHGRGPRRRHAVRGDRHRYRRHGDCSGHRAELRGW
jgi:hypothetical protein